MLSLMFPSPSKDTFEIHLLVIPTYHISVGTAEQFWRTRNGFLSDEMRLAGRLQECT